MTQQIDYDALAQQHGAAPPPVDYDALASQHGGSAGGAASTLEKEGFWHSLGSVFGLTPEAIAAQQKEMQDHPIKFALKPLDPRETPGGMLVRNLINTTPGLARKASEESQASSEAARHGDIASFLAHQIGGMGYTASALASPVLGDSPATAGEQFGEGNVKGGLGTTTGLLAPAALPEAPGAIRATGRGIETAAPYVGKGVKEAARFGGIGEFIHTGNPVALAGPAIADLAGKGAMQATSWLGRFMQKAGGMDATSTAATVAKAESEAKAVPGAPESSPSTLPRVNSGEGVLNMALTALDNKSLLKVAKSRGINVAQESQLKAGAANPKIISKIINDFTPDELDEIRNMGMEISRNVPVQNPNVTPEAAAEAWHYKVLNQFFPDVAIPKTMAARAQATIANRPLSPREQAFYAQAESQAKPVPSDVPASPEWSLENMQKQIMLNQARRAKTASGK